MAAEAARKAHDVQSQALCELFAYNYHTNHTLLDLAAQLPDVQGRATMPVSFGSIYATLAHIFGAEQLWRMRVQEGVSPPRIPDAHDFATLAELRAAWQAEEAAMRAYLATLTQADLLLPVTYTNTHGVVFQRPRWKCLTHIVLHGMQHRSEVAAMLTALGKSPGNIDLIYFELEEE